MIIFRKLADNIFFKILLGILVLAFVLFGVSDFILKSPNNWIAKVGGKEISYNQFLVTIKRYQNLLLSQNPDSQISEEALSYANSTEFKSHVLQEMISKSVIERLMDDMEINPGNKPILEIIAKDPNFKNSQGKFDQRMFAEVLARNHLSEEEYVSLIKDKFVSQILLQSLTQATPINSQLVIELAEFKNEKRIANVVTVSLKDIPNPVAPTDKELDSFFEINKSKFLAPEYRKISYLFFSKNDLIKDQAISSAEAKQWYEQNINNYRTPEQRDFYHILFSKAEDAKTFLNKLKKAAGNNAKTEAAFTKLAAANGKSSKEILLSNVVRENLIPSIQKPVFELKAGEYTEVLKSSLGYHVFLLAKIKEGELIPFSQVEKDIESKLLASRKDEALRKKFSEIEDALLVSNSIPETAQKFGLKLNTALPKIDSNKRDKKGQIVEVNLEGFLDNAFATEAGSASKIFYSKPNDTFYALKIEEVEPARERSLTEVRSEVIAEWTHSKKLELLAQFAKKIEEEIKAGPGNISAIAAKHRLKFEKNREFSRLELTANKNGLLHQLFELKADQTTLAWRDNKDQFLIAVLVAVNHPPLNTEQIEAAKTAAAEGFKEDVFNQYNAMLQKKYPIKINEKLLKSDQ